MGCSQSFFSPPKLNRRNYGLASIEQSNTNVDPIDFYDYYTQIRMINYDVLKICKSYPRYPHKINLCTDLNSIDRSKSFIIYVSYRWFNNNNDDINPIVDEILDSKSSKRKKKKKKKISKPKINNDDSFKLLLKQIELLKKSQVKKGITECFVWIDYCCVNQDNEISLDYKYMDKIIQACDCMITPIVDDEWFLWEFVPSSSGYLIDYKAKAFIDGTNAYLNRGWCRIEMLYNAFIPLADDIDQRIDKFQGELASFASKGLRPHFIYGTYEFMKKKSPICLEPLTTSSTTNIFLDKSHPTKGYFSNVKDVEKVSALFDILKNYIQFRIDKESGVQRNDSGFIERSQKYSFTDGSYYEGEWKVINGRNVQHGIGKYTFADGSYYDGDWVNGKKDGRGVYQYSSGALYEGTFQDDKKDGYGRYVFPGETHTYIGEFKNGKMEGVGKYVYSNGRVKEGYFKDDALSFESPPISPIKKTTSSLSLSSSTSSASSSSPPPPPLLSLSTSSSSSSLPSLNDLKLNTSSYSFFESSFKGKASNLSDAPHIQKYILGYYYHYHHYHHHYYYYYYYY